MTTLSVLVLAGSLSVVALPAADAGTAFRYWSYWNAGPGEAAWRYANEGSGTRIPPDGAVEGWRFGIAGDAARIQPDLAPDFASICAGVNAPDGGKRVAVIVDPGSGAEAPEGETPGPVITECVTTRSSSTGLQILQIVSDVRMDAGFVCGIGGYPVRECAPLVEPPSESSASTDASAAQSSDSPPIAASETTPATASGTPLATAAVVSIAALAGFGVWRRRRRVRA